MGVKIIAENYVHLLVWIELDYLFGFELLCAHCVLSAIYEIFTICLC